VVFFSIFTGAGVSVIRAAVMGLIALIVKYSGRANHSLLVLLITGLVMVMISPRILNFDIGFQLSFFATMGLLIYMRRFEDDVRVKFLPELVKEPLLATLSALVLTLPLTIVTFHSFSLISFLANVIVLPLVPILMLLGCILAVVGLILPFFVGILAAGISVLVWLVLQTVKLLAEFPYGKITLNEQWDLLWCIYYAALFMAFHKPKLDRTVYQRCELPGELNSIQE